MSGSGNPAVFSGRSALLLVVVGAALFLALMWMIGTGNGFSETNDGGNHAGGKGLNGFAGLERLAEAQGWDARVARSDAALNQPGLLVLTPAPDAPGAEIARIVERHRRIGPVMVIAPKWVVARLSANIPGAKDGWVGLVSAQAPSWPHFLDRVRVGIGRGDKGAAPEWRAAGLQGRLPDASAIETGGGEDDGGHALVPLVELAAPLAGGGDTLLAGYVAAARHTPLLDSLALLSHPPVEAGDGADSDYPLVLVFEPDLLDNYGLNAPVNVALAGQLLSATVADAPREVTFDLTLNGLGHVPNLLTLAFTPPYLAATLCLIFAALAAGWRSFCRFGAARLPLRELEFGKRRLVANGGALILRARRLHLLGPAYASAARERIARALALPRLVDADRTDAAIDRALAARTSAPGSPADTPPPGFTETARKLAEARGETAMVEAARALHRLERMLIE